MKAFLAALVMATAFANHVGVTRPDVFDSQRRSISPDPTVRSMTQLHPASAD
jgi:hypothetical protein